MAAPTSGLTPPTPTPAASVTAWAPSATWPAVVPGFEIVSKIGGAGGTSTGGFPIGGVTAVAGFVGVAAGAVAPGLPTRWPLPAVSRRRRVTAPAARDGVRDRELA